MVTARQLSFSGGEIAPAVYGRVDQVKYATGLRTCRNFFIGRHGGAFNRPGTGFVAEVKNSAKAVRLIPFVFNPDQTYVLEFGDLYMRVYRNGGQVLETAKTITGITQANPAVVTSVAHGFANGQEVFLKGVVGMTEVNQRNFKVAGVTADTFQLQLMDSTNLNSTGFGAYVSGGTAERVFEIVTPYVEADLPDLQYVQSADVVTIVHPTYPPRELKRTGHTAWTLTTITFAPKQVAPTGVTVTQTGVPGTETHVYHVTAIAAETFEESLAVVKSQPSLTKPTTTDPHTISWTAAANAQEYNVYHEKNGVPGFIGTAVGTTFKYDGAAEDLQDTPPIARNPFDAAGKFPSTVSYFQQRHTFANTDNSPEKVFTSRTNLFTNFTVSSPIQDDDAVTFSLSGRQVNEIRHLVDLGRLIVFTTSGEWLIGGDSAGILKPNAISPQQQGYNGSAILAPLPITGNVLYVQARGSIVRDLGFDLNVDGYAGNDLTIFSAHLFDAFTIKDWTYQRIPHSLVWIARSDGKLLALTYLREHQVWAWHRHDFDGTVENVVAVPEGLEDAVYLILKRTVNAKSVRYLERMKSRRIDKIKDAVFMDSSLSLDGTNTNTSHTMTLSGGTNWTFTETLTLTSSLSFFASSDVGNAIHLTGSDGTLMRFTIDAFTSATVVTGKAHKTVPAAMRNAAISNWAKAVDEVGGLWHLEGKKVSILGDAFVVANPNNVAHVVRTVSSGKVALDKPYAVIHVGLPITSDLETLDIDTTGAETLADKKKLITRLTMFVETSRGIFVGARPPSNDSVDPLENLVEMKLRGDEGYDEPVDPETGTIGVNLKSEWNSNGRVFIRQVDPLPLAVLAVAPAGLIPIGR